MPLFYHFGAYQENAQQNNTKHIHRPVAHRPRLRTHQVHQGIPCHNDHREGHAGNEARLLTVGVVEGQGEPGVGQIEGDPESADEMRLLATSRLQRIKDYLGVFGKENEKQILAIHPILGILTMDISGY